MRRWCKCIAGPQEAEARAAPTVGKIAIPATFSVQSPSAEELGTPKSSPRDSTKSTPRRRNASLEGRWNPTPYEAPPKEPLATPQKSAREGPPAPDSARARAMKFEELAAANKPPPEPEPTNSWWNPFAPAKPTKNQSKPESVANTPRPNPDKPALVLWTNATSPRTSEAELQFKSPAKVRRNSYGTPAPPTPDSALGKVKMYEDNVQAHSPAEPEPVAHGWVQQNGTYKKEHAPLPPKKLLEDLP